jgi:hypothetical protein
MASLIFGFRIRRIDSTQISVINKTKSQSYGEIVFEEEKIKQKVR